MTPPLQKAFTPDPEFKARLAAAKQVPIAEIWTRLGLPEVPASGIVSSPFRPDAHPSFRVGGENNFCFDFARQQSWDGPDLVQELTGCNLPDAIRFCLGEQLEGRIEAKPYRQPATTESAKKERAGSGAGKLWHSETEALSALDSLPLVADDPAAVEWFEREYKLVSVPETWRLFTHSKLGAGVAYPGFDLSGRLVSVKWRGFQRDGHGKRPCRFLFGAGGYQVLKADGADWAIVSGEEKQALLWNLGISSLGLLTGERGLPADAAQWVAKTAKEKILLANDGDKAGRAANDETMKSLHAAGVPLDRIFCLDLPDGCDVNDVAKAPENWDKPLWSFATPAELEGVNETTESEKTLPDVKTETRGIALTDWFKVEIPPVDFLIQGVVPAHGRLLISGQAKAGKTRWTTNLALSLASGTEFSGFKINRPVKVLYLQNEIPDALYRDELLRRMFDGPPDGFNSDLAAQNFFYYQTRERMPNWMDSESRQEIMRTIEHHHPDVLVLDPIYSLAPGLSENDADQVSLFLRDFSELAAHGPSVFLVHHSGKNGQYRGSTVFEGWGDAMVTLTNRQGVIEVGGCYRYSVQEPKQVRQNEYVWFESVSPEDMPVTTRDAKGSPKAPSASKAIDVLKRRDGCGMRYTAFYKEIEIVFGVSESTARRSIKMACESGFITIIEGEHYLTEKARSDVTFSERSRT